MDLNEMAALVAEITYKDGYLLTIKRDQRVRATEHARPYLQVRFWRADSVTGEMGWGYSGKSYVSEAMTVTEFLNAAFGVFVRLEEHECREAFKWRGRAINGPHVDAEARWEIARRVDVRPAPTMPELDRLPATPELDAEIDRLHGPGAAAAIDRAFVDGTL